MFGWVAKAKYGKNNKIKLRHYVQKCQMIQFFNFLLFYTKLTYRLLVQNNYSIIKCFWGGSGYKRNLNESYVLNLCPINTKLRLENPFPNWLLTSAYNSITQSPSTLPPTTISLYSSSLPTPSLSLSLPFHLHHLGTFLQFYSLAFVYSLLLKEIHASLVILASRKEQCMSWTGTLA